MRILAIALAAALFAVAGCSAGAVWKRDLEVEVVGTWSGVEQDRFEQVLRTFEDRTGVEVTYTPAGDELQTVLGTRLQGDSPPNIALVAQPGLAARYAAEGRLKPLTPSVTSVVDDNFSAAWKQLGSVGGELYGIYFKAANKSTVWYNDSVFKATGASVPRTWDEFLRTARTLSDGGTPAVAVAGADGWTLTDWFENVYLRTAGPENYDRLGRHEIPWTDATVRTALLALAQVFGAPQVVEGGATGALQTDFPRSVTTVFRDPPQAAMVFEGDFVSGVISSGTRARVGIDARFFPFPSIGGSGDVVVAGGDMAVQFKDDAATTALMRYLASAEAAEVWAGMGGFLSPNRNVRPESYPDDVSRELAGQLVKAGASVRFDMSDLAPTAFGGTRGAGQWKVLQDFLADPDAVDATMRRLEAEASKAYGG